MTDELLKQANSLKHTIDDLTNEIALVEDMHHCDDSIQICCDNIGRVFVNDELKDDIIDLILNRLNTKKEEVEDDYRRL